MLRPPKVHLVLQPNDAMRGRSPRGRNQYIKNAFNLHSGVKYFFKLFLGAHFQSNPKKHFLKVECARPCPLT